MTPMIKGRSLTMVMAIVGTAIFVAFGLPLPLLLGPMSGCLIAALAGAPLRDMGAFGQLMRTFLGVAIGSSVTWGLIENLSRHSATLAMMPIFVLVIGAIGYPFFRKVMGFDHPTAFYSAMPGGLQDMLIFGEEAGGDVRAMSLVHATRVLVIVTAAPFFLTWAYNADLTRPPGAMMSDIPLLQIMLMVGAGIVGWKLAERVGLFGASILGPLILTAGLSLAGVIQQRPPAEMIWAAQFFIGITVGAKYSGITARELRVDVSAGIAFALILSILSLGFIEIAVAVSPADTLDVILSFLPGGQAEMAVIAIVTGADVAFVVAHHLTRIFLVILLAPIAARLFGRPRKT
ncbi:AbrB family transcriptional regulator [Phaeovulum sp.]|uniref:AbrB family transcriptional regulator n=1 Tax=Phaeovulum sp. TaxID=2934796 RepID=UPI0039E23074